MDYSNKSNPRQSQVLIKFKIRLISYFIVNSIIRPRKQKNISHLIMTTISKWILNNIIIKHQITRWFDSLDNMIILMIDIDQSPCKSRFSASWCSRDQDSLSFISQQIKKFWIQIIFFDSHFFDRSYHRHFNTIRERCIYNHNSIRSYLQYLGQFSINLQKCIFPRFNLSKKLINQCQQRFFTHNFIRINNRLSLSWFSFFTKNRTICLEMKRHSLLIKIMIQYKTTGIYSCFTHFCFILRIKILLCSSSKIKNISTILRLSLSISF